MAASSLSLGINATDADAASAGSRLTLRSCTPPRIAASSASQRLPTGMRQSWLSACVGAALAADAADAAALLEHTPAAPGGCLIWSWRWRGRRGRASRRPVTRSGTPCLISASSAGGSLSAAREPMVFGASQVLAALVECCRVRLARRCARKRSSACSTLRLRVGSIATKSRGTLRREEVRAVATVWARTLGALVLVRCLARRCARKRSRAFSTVLRISLSIATKSDGSFASAPARCFQPSARAANSWSPALRSTTVLFDAGLRACARARWTQRFFGECAFHLPLCSAGDALSLHRKRST